MRRVVFTVVVLVHGAIVAAWLDQRMPRALPRPMVVTLQLLPEAAPPPPPVEVPVKQPLRRTMVAASRLVAPRTRVPAIAPVPAAAHRPDAQEWIAPVLVDPVPVARRAPSEYAYQVKSRIISQVIYPKDALYPAPKGYKGDPRIFIRECTIAYELVVDRQGRLVSYDLDPCQDDLLAPAAEAAILKAQPYPPPPEGAEQYRIYGSINFKKPKLVP